MILKNRSNALASTDVKENAQPHPVTHAFPHALLQPRPSNCPEGPLHHPHSLPHPVYMPVFPPCVPSANNFVNS